MLPAPGPLEVFSPNSSTCDGEAQGVKYLPKAIMASGRAGVLTRPPDTC